jgi:hypothetical protein
MDTEVDRPEETSEDRGLRTEVLIEPTAEEIELARKAAIEANDREVADQLRRMSRRGFLTLGAGAVAAVGAWKWLGSRDREGGIAWPLRKTLHLDEAVALSYFSTSRLNPTFPPSMITRPARLNGGEGLDQHADLAGWRLDFAAHALTLDDIKAFPKRTMITEFRCIEGWSTIVQWGGTRLSDVMAKLPPPPPARYLSMSTPGGGYYVSLDMPSAMHPQTLLAYEMNGAPLTWQHGAPLRLAIPVKYGVKNIKRIGQIAYSAIRPPDFWGERGYDDYAGH